MCGERRVWFGKVVYFELFCLCGARHDCGDEATY